MASREDLGSWLEGTPGRDGSGGRPGTPPEGRGARAGSGRRAVALLVDWTLSLAVSGAFWPDPSSAAPRFLAGQPLATLAVFAVSTVVLVATLGTTVGHRLLGLRVVPADADGAPAAATRPAGAPEPGPGLRAALVRTLLLCLVIPAAVWDRQGRGMHDAAARTAIVRR